MRYFNDLNKRKIRFTDERRNHLEQNHPEMVKQERRIKEALESPDKIILSKTDSKVELFYKYYENTPVNAKHLCVVVKSINDDSFIITSYFMLASLWGRYNKKREIVMDKEIKVWYDKEGDYLEVIFEKKEGYFKETDNDAVMEKIDNKGNILGFSILKVSELNKIPLSVSLKSSVA